MPDKNGHNDGLDKLQAIVDKLERLSLEQKIGDPKRERELDDLLRESRDAIRSVIEERRRRDDQTRIAELLEAIGQNTASFLTAISTNTATANDLLTVSEQRLQQIEAELAAGGTAFEADPEVLDEGEFLKAQLTGVEGTEGPGPLFKDATPVVTDTGLEVLAAGIASTTSIRSRKP